MLRNSFTLIELLIVVAIIGILAAIALPNFYGAMTRAKIARVHADLHAYATACEQYRLDRNTYPWPLIEALKYDAFTPYIIFELTTPISYLSSANGVDPFNDRKTWKGRNYSRLVDDPWYYYYYYQGHYATMPATAIYSNKPNGFAVSSLGPDRILSGGMNWPLSSNLYGVEVSNNSIYDTSNGLISQGDIIRFGGEANAPVTMGK